MVIENSKRGAKLFAETCATSLSHIPVCLPGNNCQNTHTAKLRPACWSFRLTQIHHTRFISQSPFLLWDSSAAWVRCNPAAEAYTTPVPTHKLSADCAGELHPKFQNRLSLFFFSSQRWSGLIHWQGSRLTHAAQRTAHPKIFREGSGGFVSADPLV